jgi:hypothetical protein
VLGILSAGILSSPCGHRPTEHQLVPINLMQVYVGTGYVATDLGLIAQATFGGDDIRQKADTGEREA